MVSQPPRLLDPAGVGPADPQPGLLDGVVGLGGGAEHAVGDRPQVGPVGLEPLRQPAGLVHVTQRPGQGRDGPVWATQGIPPGLWNVDDIEAALASLLEAGAESRQPVSDVGGGRRIATVQDLDGNVIGLLQDP